MLTMLTRHGNQGQLDTASKGTLEDEFGTSRDEDVVQQILEKGTVLETEVRLPFNATYLQDNANTCVNQEKGRSGDRNITAGPSVAHS
jgi:hypothetical protein